MILVCYDGSVNAQAAIDHAAGLMEGAEAAVLTIWEPFLDGMIRSGAMGMGMGMGMAIGPTIPFDDDEKIDAANQQAALQTATNGAERATAAGLHAQPHTASGHGGVPNAILTVAADVNANVIVLGTRGLGGMKSFLLGSVSHAVIQHADRAVLIVPSSELAEQRHRWARHTDATGERP
ncbi:MAG: universal stress protein [Actinomycetota bacterium]|nr:universal stress protein [Actinomycetota bacterium]